MYTFYLKLFLLKCFSDEAEKGLRDKISGWQTKGKNNKKEGFLLVISV